MSKNNKKKRKETLDRLGIEEAKYTIIGEIAGAVVDSLTIGIVGGFFVFLGLSATKQLGELIFYGLGFGLWLAAISPIWTKAVYYPNQKRIFDYICKNKQQIKKDESRQWLDEVETQEIDHDALQIKRLPDGFLWEDVIPPSMKKRINDPTVTFLGIGFDVFLAIILGLLILIIVEGEDQTERIIAIILGLISGILLIRGLWGIYKNLSIYYRSYHKWYDEEYFRLLSERGSCLATLKEDPMNQEAQAKLDVVFQLIRELEDTGRTPWPSIKKLIVPAVGICAFLVQFLF